MTSIKAETHGRNKLMSHVAEELCDESDIYHGPYIIYQYTLLHNLERPLPNIGKV